jgi:hypothetical protein
MPFLENLETSIADNDGMANNEKVINEGLEIIEKPCCSSCSCKTTGVNNLLESQTSFE